MRTVVTVGVAAAVGLVLVAALASARRGEPDLPRTEEVPEEFRVEVTPEMERHTAIRNALYVIGTGWLWGSLWIVLRSGWSARMREIADRISSRRFIRDASWFALFVTTMAVLLFPLDLYSGFIVRHQFELSNQSFGQWVWESAKGLAVAIVVGSPIAAGALLLIRKRPRRWWAWLWAASIPLTLVSVLLAPLVIEPLFNEFTRLENRGLEERLLTLASYAGIESSDVFVVDKSRQTRTMNAYVTGLGGSKRIVIWDTLLARMEDDEVVFVMAHEIGHYVRHDVWKGIGFGITVMFFVFWAGSRVAEAGLERHGGRWGARERHDPAVLPWYLLVLAVGTFLLSPVFSGYSRAIEHAADVYALEATGLAEPGARAFIKLAEGSKIDPAPHPLMKFWRYSHPPLAERIEFALKHRE